MVKNIKDNDYIAHVRKKDDDSWDYPHLLSEHLEMTAARAERFAAKFYSGTWGRAAGLAHDTGKGREEWQRYLKQKSGYDEEAHLEGKTGKKPHAIHGAKVVEELYGKAYGRLLAYIIAGHHSGLPDWSPAEGAGNASLQQRISRLVKTDDIATFITEEIKKAKPEPLPRPFERGLDFALWCRMLYSCLVDADFLDTEYYMEEKKSAKRGGYLPLDELMQKFHKHIDRLEAGSAVTGVNSIRKNIRLKCLNAAKSPQGIFSLTVPTGGGKTLSSLAFGLEHAIKHNLDRIIYVIPYTSIIEQNADVFRSAVGEDQVIEHHSSLAEEDSTPKSRLSAENWDAPVIVTTTVQFFESLFAAKSSRCRKLHNITNSVIILDEAQLLPVDFLAPILETMQLLVDHYGVTFVISTATQPAFEERTDAGGKFKGLKEIKEIIGDPESVNELYESLKRVDVEVPEDFNTAKTWEEIALSLTDYRQVLCVVSDRVSCRTLHALMPEGTYHLSALMCGEHRSESIAAIKEKLKNNEPVRVISTQLVEAGVDMDFPIVYRAMAGLDSIAQAAGRCNREGRNDALGKVVVFISPKKAPLGILRKGTETAVNIFSSSSVDPLDHSLYRKYFAELYWKANSLDTKEITGLLTPDSRDCGVFFRTASERFQIIDDKKQKTIIVLYKESKMLINMLKKTGPERWLMRKLQRYTVNVYIDDFYKMHQRGAVEEIYPHIFALASETDYSPEVGLNIGETVFDAGGYIF